MTVPLALNSTVGGALDGRVDRRACTVAVEPRASAICEATVRFQISS